MKLALKYGIAVTAVIAGWVAIKHFVLHLESQDAQVADIAIFNFAAIVGLLLGIREKRATNGGSLTFGSGLVTGISIAVTYAILTSAYFMILLVVVGPKLMQQEGDQHAEGLPRSFAWLRSFRDCLFSDDRAITQKTLTTPPLFAAQC